MRERRKELERGREEVTAGVEMSLLEGVDRGDSEEESWCEGKCGSVRRVGGVWWFVWGVVRREIIQDFEWQSVG